MKIIGVIPARYKSGRFPGNLLANICGRPIICRVYQQCIKVEAFDIINGRILGCYDPSPGY